MTNLDPEYWEYFSSLITTSPVSSLNNQLVKCRIGLIKIAEEFPENSK